MTSALIEFMQSWRDQGPAGMAVLALIFVFGALLFTPRAPICFISGLVFGFWAVPIAVLASTGGAVIAFLLSRYVFRKYVFRAIHQRPVWQAVIEAIDKEGWRLVGLLRLASPVPGTVTNYLLGLTRIGVWPYAAATFAGLLPQTLLFVYMGAIGKYAIEDLSGSALGFTLFAVGLLCTAITFWLIARRIKNILIQYRIA